MSCRTAVRGGIDVGKALIFGRAAAIAKDRFNEDIGLGDISMDDFMNYHGTVVSVTNRRGVILDVFGFFSYSSEHGGADSQRKRYLEQHWSEFIQGKITYHDSHTEAAFHWRRFEDI